MREHDPNNRMQRSPQRRRSRNRGGKLIPLVVFLLFGLFIATQEIPRVHDWVEGFINPQQAEIRRNCIGEALAASSEPDYARVVETGEVESTANGYLVRKIVIGEMAEDGGETEYRFNCYFDAAGTLIRSHREES